MRKTNNKSITALTLGVLSIILPYIGIILGIIGIFISRKSIIEIATTNETGNGFAIAGKVCSIIGICLQTLSALVLTIAFYQSMR